MIQHPPAQRVPPKATARGVYRHPLPVRITHWLNVFFLTVMLGSGLQIFNAHPALYWGSRGSDPDLAWLAMYSLREQGELKGIARIGGVEFDTTGVFGVSGGDASSTRGFPAWATIPGPRWLAMGRRWHFFFAWLFVINGLVYAGYALFGGHLARQLLPRRRELGGAGRTLREHLRLGQLRAASARGYNVLQKLSYLLVVFVLGPLVLLTGLTMSPTLDTAWPWLLDLFGGRQSARSLHFLAAFAFVAFTLVHVGMVVLAGPVRHLRAMVTGWFRNGGSHRE